MSTMKQPRNATITRDQSGMASLLFTLVMMVVISLIVIGFAQLARRGQRETLDSQLSTQAYYAAESGIDDAESVILSNLSSPNLNNSPCTPSGLYAGFTAKQVLGNGVSYTCFSVDSQPNDLTGDLTANKSEIFQVNPVNGNTPTAPGSLNLQWQAPTNTNGGNCPGLNSQALVASSAWTCPYAMLRVDLVPTDTVTRAALAQKTMTVFIFPTNTAGSSASYTDGAGANQGGFGYASCTTVAAAATTNSSDTCTASLSNLTSTGYEMRIMPLYTSAPGLIISAANPALKFANGQAVIDVTGKAQDVLRRVQVRMSLGASVGNASDYTLLSNSSICKRFTVGSSTIYTEYNDIVTCN